MDEPITHTRSDVLAALDDEEFGRLAARLSKERADLELEGSALLDPVLRAIDSADLETIHKAIKRRDEIKSRLHALALAEAAIEVEFERRRKPGVAVRPGQRSEGRERYLRAVRTAYQEFSTIDPRTVHVTWRTQPELIEIDRQHKLHEELLRGAPLMKPRA